MNRETTITATISGSIALGVYLLTLAPDLTWSHWSSDGGELITAAVTLGIPHPPGYPTYVLLGKLISMLPIRPIALTFNLFSALCTATAAALITHHPPLTDYRSPITAHRSPFPPLAAGLTFAFASLVWSQAIVTEVYGLNLLMLAAFLWALLHSRPFAVSGLLLGLSITTHLTSLFMLPLALALTPRGQWWRLSLGVVAGLTPFLLLPALARTDSPVVWGQPTNLSAWWWLVSGRIYQANAFALPLPELITRGQTWGRLLLAQFAFIGLPLILVGFHPRLHHLSHTRQQNGLLAATAVLYILYALAYNTDDAAVLLLPAILIGVILLLPALQPLRAWALLLPLALLLLNFHKLNLHQDYNLRARAESALQHTPDNSIVLTPGNQTIFALWYLHHVEGQRPDVILVDENLFAFAWYRQQLARRYPELHHPAGDDLMGFITENQTSFPVTFVDLGKVSNN